LYPFASLHSRTLDKDVILSNYVVPAGTYINKDYKGSTTVNQSISSTFSGVLRLGLGARQGILK